MKKTDILDAINQVIVEKWPNRTFYIDVCPIDFERPSFWLAVEKHDITDANKFLIKNTLQLKLTIYDELDEHYEASWYRLSKETDAVMELLGLPLKVCGRHLKFSLKALPRDPDRASIQINVAWMDNRPSHTDNVPPADTYKLHIQGSD